MFLLLSCLIGIVLSDSNAIDSRKLMTTGSSFACQTSLDCEMLGNCSAGGVCQCSRGWTGPTCGVLDLAPATPLSEGGMVWPRYAVSAAKAASSWGFTPTVDENGMEHAFVTVACNASGVVGSGGGNSWIAHIASSQGEDHFDTFLGMLSPQTTFGPHIARSLDNSTYVLIFRVNVLVNTTLCSGNATAPLPPAYVDGSEVPADLLTSGNPEVGTSIYVAWTGSLVEAAAAGAAPQAWQVVKINITGAGTTHKSNPSILQLPDGRWLMGYRYNPPGGGEAQAVAIATDFRGPYAFLANVTGPLPKGAGGSPEDPFVFLPPAAAEIEGGSEYGHLIVHDGPYSFHAFGKLDGSEDWMYTPSGAVAFSTNVSFSDGSKITLQRRERPELRFRPDGSPAMLYNGVVDAEGTAFSFAQPIY